MTSWMRSGKVLIGFDSAISRDPKLYTAPAVFEPARFLGPTPECDPATFVFGFGPR
jgi:cytochrome P450